MNKSAIQKYAIWARNELIEQVKQRAFQFGISESGYGDENASVVSGRVLSNDEKRQRKQFIEVIKRSTYLQTIEEVAYTWFNRFIALRYMEVNDYLPTHVRVLSDASGNFKPEILSNILHIDLPGLDKNKVSEYLNSNQTQELYRYLLLTQCNALNELLPEMFERLGAYTEMLLPNNILKPEGVIGRLVNDIPEEDFKDAVQIIGWMYQYYNTEPKQEVFDGLKKNIKITKEKISAATQLFTPDWIVRYMVENSLGRLWLDSHPNSKLREGWKYYVDEAEQTPEVTERLRLLRTENAIKSPEDIKFIDPCMGSGHILVYAFDVLMQIYTSEGYSERDAAQLILESNLFGLDIDRRAFQLSYFALMMKARQFNRRILNLGIRPQVYEPTGYPEGMEFGSLIKVDDLEPKPEETLEYQFNLFDENYEVKLNTWNFRRLLSQKYHIVATNPPYIGSDNMVEKLKKFLEKNFFNERYDIYAAFISKSLEIKQKNGYLAIITQHSYLYSLSFSRFRDFLVKESTIVSAIHLGPRAFEDISGEVVQTIATIFYTPIEAMKSSVKRLVEYPNKIKAFFEEKPYTFEMSLFNDLPNKVFAYSIDDSMLRLITEEKKIGDYFTPKAGIVTGNDEYFLRYWFEINSNEFDLNAVDTTSKYVPFSKGGTFVKWFGNVEYAIKLNDLWDDKIANKSVRRGDRSSYFKPAIGWSYMGGGNSKSFSIIRNALCGTGTPTILSENNNEELFYYTLGFLNTSIPRQFIELFNPMLNTYSGDIANLPIVLVEDPKYVVNSVMKCIELAKVNWDRNELSWDFTRHSLVTNSTLIDESYKKLISVNHDRNNALKSEEEYLNSFFYDIYGINRKKSIDNKLENLEIHLDVEIRTLLSYFVGCLFGRYSLDNEGLIYAGGEWDMAKYHKFPVDKDNIIPILDDEYFEDDIVGRFITFVKIVYGEDTLEENLKFVADSLGGKGTSREIIRNYFINDFYNDHLKIYQKRPIYWLFDSGKKNGFKSLIYMHRYSSDLLAKLRTDYVHEQQERYRTQLSRISSELNNALGNERSKLLKQQDKLTEQLKEITLFEEKVHHLADQHIDIDLDDGVKKNYALFEDVLAKI